MNKPLMPKATAVWLIENTKLTFDQIAAFCSMHPLEVQGVADGDVATGIIGQDPVLSGQVSREEIEKCEKDSSRALKMNENFERFMKSQGKKKSRYTPVARRQDKPDAIAWFVKTHPDVSDTQIAKLIGTTKTTIAAVRERSHWNIANIKPRDPVLLGLCTQTDLEKVIEKAAREKERAASAKKSKKAKEKEAAA